MGPNLTVHRFVNLVVFLELFTAAVTDDLHSSVAEAVDFGAVGQIVVFEVAGLITSLQQIAFFVSP